MPAAGSFVPCLELGGDYLGQFRLADGRAAFVVADVCGKGVQAALLAAALQGALETAFETEPSLPQSRSWSTEPTSSGPVKPVRGAIVAATAGSPLLRSKT